MILGILTSDYKDMTFFRNKKFFQQNYTNVSTSEFLRFAPNLTLYQYFSLSIPFKIPACFQTSLVNNRIDSSSFIHKLFRSYKIKRESFAYKNNFSYICTSIKTYTVSYTKDSVIILCPINGFVKFEIMDLIKVAEQAFAAENPVEHPSFNTGDTVSVHYKIVEGNKERIQVFRGVVIQVKGTGSTKTFTVRKMSGNVGVERIFPIESPFIKEIEVNKVGKVRRARIYYFRNLTGKKAKIKEKRS